VPPDLPLSPREVEIAELYAGGGTYHDIALRLSIAPSTVRTHLAAIYRKLRVSSKLDLRQRLDGQTREHTDHAAIISELALSLDEAISREKALAAVLKIISGSGGDIDKVMQAILGYALQLCDAEFGILFEHTADATFRATFSRGIPQGFQSWLDAQGAFQVSPETGLGRVAAQHEVIDIIDVRAEKIYHSDDPLRHATASLGGARSFVAIPMLAGGVLVGAFTIYRQRVQPFAPDATTLAQIFADQSVIALENARMVGALREAQAARNENRPG
jgi:DNA-binding CsgD family transcriptional regulator